MGDCEDKSNPVEYIRPKETFITPFQQLICSSAGAFVTSTITTPLDVVKVRLQAQEKAKVPAQHRTAQQFVYRSNVMRTHCLCTECSVSIPDTFSNLRAAPKFSGFWDALLKIARNEGVTVLWSGLPTTWIMAVPATVVYFTTYDQLKYRLGYDEMDSSTMYIPVIAGCMARLFAATIVSPLELVRTKMQSKVLSYAELRQAVATSVKNNGILFMMRGLGPSLLRDVPFSAIYWYGYEYVKSRNLRQTGLSQPTVAQTFVAGTISGTIAAVMTLPFDVVKTHRQIELGDRKSVV